MTDEDVRQALVKDAVTMYEGGATIAEIKNELGHSNTMIYQLLREGGVEPRRREETPLNILDVFPDVTIEKVVTAYVKGDSMVKIRKETELSYNTIYAILAAKKVPLRRTAGQSKEDPALEQAIRMYEDGAKLIMIEIETGVSQTRLYKELYLRKITLRRDIP